MNVQMRPTKVVSPPRCKRRILVIAPYQARDLEGHALVAHRLIRRYGYDVMLSNGYEIERKVLEYRPDAVVFDHLAWDFKVQQARLVKRLGAKVIVLPTEGLFQDTEGAVRRAGKLHGATRVVDCYLAWGQYPQNALLAEKLMDPDRIHTPGCPRFDLYREPFLSARPGRDALLGSLGIKNPQAPFVLWATNTPYASRNPQKMLARQIQRARKPAPEVQAHIADHITQHRVHSKVVLELAQRHPEWNFVIKVHPAEWINPYVELAKQAPNLALAYNAPIHVFLQHCDLLMQRNCTTASEAWLLGKPVINLEIGEYRRPVRPEYRLGNHPVASIDDAEKAVRAYLDGAEIPQSQRAARDAFIADFYGPVDGRAGKRCADLIAQAVSPPSYTDDDQARTFLTATAAFTEWQAAQDRRWSNRLKDVVGLNRRTSLRLWRRLAIREDRDNLGVFQAEADITRESADAAIARYDSLLPTELEALT
jgi:surface carbohydrate biosynthesis protein